MALQPPLRIKLLSVPDCPLVERVHQALSKSLAHFHHETVLEEHVGDYSSPTLLIDGFDVTGQLHTQAAPSVACCRLDLPTTEQITAALAGLSAVRPAREKLDARVQAAAFQSLLRTSQPMTTEQLAREVECDSEALVSCLGDLRQAGEVCLDSDGHISGALGLSLQPTSHELVIEEKRFGAWSAFDALGIMGALAVSGSIRLRDPSDDGVLRIEVVNGIPRERNYLIFMPEKMADQPRCYSWCSAVNLFSSAESAKDWIQKFDRPGSLLSVGNLAPVATYSWSRYLNGKE